MTKADTTVERVGGYRVVRRLATGGTSDVLLAKAEGPLGFERTVVLKLLLSQFRNDEDFARMFAREASAYARLSHPSIVRLFDFFAIPVSEPGAPPRQGGRDGQLCMVLEHVDGPPLTRLRTMLKAVGRELDDRSAIYVATRIFDALAAAHAAADDSGAHAPVIHRDVNPSNVLMPWDGHVKLADFGVAKVTGLNHQSVAGMIKGTYGYMAPEQVTGEAITPRADVYAAGIILWELLTKRRAFQRGALPEIEALRAMAEPRLIALDSIRPDVDRAVRDAVRRALEPRAERRTLTAEEMVAILSAVVPSEEGRERLVTALSGVRTSSQAAMAAVSAPPAAGLDGVRTGGGGAAPPPAPKGAASPAPPPAGRGILPKPAVPPRPESVPRMAAAAPAATLASPAAAVGPPPRRPSASMRLAGAVPESARTVGAPSSATLSIFDSLVEPPEAAEAVTEDLRLGTPLQGIAPGLALKDAIDEILRGQPSSMPPSILQTDRPAPGVPPPALPAEARGIGQLPAAPAPMNSTAPLGDFSATVRELVEKAEAPTIAPPSEIAPATPRMVPAEAPTPPPPVPATSHTTSTGRMPPYVPAAAYPTPAPPAPPRAPPPVPVSYGAGSSAPIALAAEVARPAAGDVAPKVSVPPRSSRGSVAAVVGVFVIGGLAAIAGVVAYVRHQKSHADEVGAVAASAASASGSAVTLASAAASGPSGVAAAGSASGAGSASAAPAGSASAAGSSASAAPAGSASAVASSASAAPAGSASAVASASAAGSASAGADVAPPGGAIPEGMGVVTTTGTAPGRRIFVDEKTLGQTPESVTVKCGQRVVRLGSSGKPQQIDVPCGGEIAVGDKF
ncbi:MAG: serine/threonine protein kinase [Labilithrix sp.]|nr:serine/threonine protein kinase [Labilithrix sp.]